MKKNFSPLGVFVLTTLIVSLCSVISMTLAYATAYGKAIGYFSTGAVMPVVAILLSLLFTAGIFGDAVLVNRTHKDPLCFGNPLWFRVVCVLIGAGFFGIALLDLRANATLLTTSTLVPVLAGFFGGVHFLLRAIRPSSPLPMTLTGIAVIVRLALAIGQTYFNWEIPMNAPVKLYLQLGCVAAMFFLLRDMKTTVTPTRSLVTLLSLGLGTLFTGISSLPILIAYFRRDLGTLEIFPTPFLLLLLWIYCLFRMLTLFTSPKEEPTEATPSPEEEAPSLVENDTLDPS